MSAGGPSGKKQKKGGTIGRGASGNPERYIPKNGPSGQGMAQLATRRPKGLQERATEHANIYTALDEATNNPGIKLSEGARIFPAQYFTQPEGEKDIQDRVLAATMMGDAVKAQGTNNVMVNVAPDDAMLKYIRNKDEMLWWTNFEKYLEETYINTGDLSKRDWVRKHYPQYFEMREQFIDNQLDIERRAAKLKLNGPQDMQDLFLEYLIGTGQIKLPETPVWRTDRTPEQTAEAYKRGLFNMRKTFSKERKYGYDIDYDSNGPWDKSGAGVSASRDQPLWGGGGAAARGRDMAYTADYNPFMGIWKGGVPGYAGANINR